MKQGPDMHLDIAISASTIPSAMFAFNFLTTLFVSGRAVNNGVRGRVLFPSEKPDGATN